MPSEFMTASRGRVVVGRLAAGTDLIEEIERECNARRISSGRVTVIGAVRHTRYGFYDHPNGEWLELESTTHREIVGFIGTLHTDNGRLVLHAHASFGDSSGATAGGHLLPGIEVVVAEVIIEELNGIVWGTQLGGH